MGNVRIVQARAPRRRSGRARVGVLEGVRGPTARGIDRLGFNVPVECTEAAWGRFIRSKTTRRRGPCKTPLSYLRSGALADANRDMSSARMNNLASSYQMVGRLDEALCLRQGVYSERLKVSGEEHEETLLAANNYADILVKLKRFEEAARHCCAKRCPSRDACSEIRTRSRSI